MSAGETEGGAQVRSAVRTVDDEVVAAARPTLDRLSDDTDEQVRAMLPETLPALNENTTTDREKLIEELHRVQEQGFAADREENEENTLGLRFFGVAVPCRTSARDAVSCSVPVARLTPAREQTVKDALFDARDRLTPATRRP